MSAAAFDTCAAVKTLREAGADEAMAEAIVKTAGAAAGAGHDQLATKADLAELRADVAEHQAATKAELAMLETRLTNPLAPKYDLAAELTGLRGDLRTIRWGVCLNAAILFVVAVRVYGLI